MTPSATLVLRNGFFADPISGIGFNASSDARFEYGVRATLALGRDEPARLRGLGKIHDGVAVGGFANWNVTPRFQLQSAARIGSGYHHDGTLVDVGATFDIFQQDHMSLTLEGSASYADAAYMRSYYGVSEVQSRNSGYSVYRPGAGVQWHSVGVSFSAPVHRKALASIAVYSTRLTGPAAASPYVARTDSTVIQASLSYAF